MIVNLFIDPERIAQIVARRGMVHASYDEQKQVQDAEGRAVLMQRWDDVSITRRSTTEDSWSIDKLGSVLDKAGIWHDPGLPSSRSPAFLKATRHTLQDAIELCRKYGYWQEECRCVSC